MRSPIPSERQPVFDLIAELGSVAEEEMFEVFNMGCGFCCVVAAADEAAAVRLLQRALPAGAAASAAPPTGPGRS